MTRKKTFLWAGLLLATLVVAQLSCGGGGMKQSTNSISPSSPTTGQDLCVCTDTTPASSDFRTDAKHVPLPQIAANEISVGTILSWPVPAEPAFDAARQGRELQLFHISQAFLQFAWLNTGDCDLHLEISDSQDKNAPRVIVETPFGDTFCSARRQLGMQLSAKGFTLSSSSGELPTAVAVDVVGLAFQDFNHLRGTPHVATVWELHPAVVTLK
ncbi:MAG TPA: hypothetical protein VHA33_20260 [Candidatus Angelobacter sp.]|nr:hypothetical protein [Candidatus Angelobacter sp.]